MAANKVYKDRAVILTAIPIEYEAVRAHLSDIREETHPEGTVYERGTFSSGSWVWDVCIAEIGAGNSGAAFEAERAIAYFRPSVAVFVGVAGGVKDVKLGDVVVATKIYGYESGKVQDEQFLPRPSVGESSYRLVKRAEAEARKKGWLQSLLADGQALDPTPRVFVGPIAAGEKVMASKVSQLFKFLQTNYGDTLAIEMEGRGFLRATHANERVKAIVIRGISDLIEGKSQADSQGSQEKAARHASAFAFEMLAKLDLPQQGSGADPVIRVQPALAQQEQVKVSSVPEKTSDFEIFYSYVEEDNDLVKQLKTHLTLLKKQDYITDWYADKLSAGGERDESMRHLNLARIILLLVSPDFVASDHHYDVEIKRAMARHDAGEARVIPIILRSTEGWQKEPFGRLQFLPRGDKPLIQYTGGDRDAMLAQIAREIRVVVEELKNGSS